jgi:hypothetical protein
MMGQRLTVCRCGTIVFDLRETPNATMAALDSIGKLIGVILLYGCTAAQRRQWHRDWSHQETCGLCNATCGARLAMSYVLRDDASVDLQVWEKP